MDPQALQISDRHFEVHGDKFEYEKVQSIRWETREIIRTIYFIPVRVDYAYDLVVQFFCGTATPTGVCSASGGVPTFSQSEQKQVSGAR